MKHAHEELGGRLAALRADFAALGTRAAGAAEALTATLPPPTALLDELTAAHTAFADLRIRHGRARGRARPGARHRGARHAARPRARAGRHRRRRGASRAAGRVAGGARGRPRRARPRDGADPPRGEGLRSRSPRRSSARASCTARSPAPAPDDLEHETKLLPGRIRPYAELLALVDGWNVLDDDRCAFLQDAITEAFSRPLGLAALRGKLGREGELAAGAGGHARGRPMIPVAPAAVAPGMAAPPLAPAPMAPVPMEPAACRRPPRVYAAAAPVAAPPPAAPRRRRARSADRAAAAPVPYRRRPAVPGRMRRPRPPPRQRAPASPRSSSPAPAGRAGRAPPGWPAGPAGPRPAARSWSRSG